MAGSHVCLLLDSCWPASPHFRTHSRLSSGARWAAPLHWNLCTSDGKDRCPNTWAMETQGYWSSDFWVWDCSADPTTPQEHWLPLWPPGGRVLTATKAQRPWEGSPKLPPPSAGPCPAVGAVFTTGGELVCRAAVSAVCAVCADKLPSPDVPRVSRRLLPSRLSPSSESTVLCAGGGQPFPATLPQGLLWPLGARDLHLKVWTLSCHCHVTGYLHGCSSILQNRVLHGGGS